PRPCGGEAAASTLVAPNSVRSSPDPMRPAGADWRRADIRIAGIGGLVSGGGAVHGPAKAGPATGRNPTVREGASASPKGLKARSSIGQRGGLASTHTRRAPGSAWLRNWAGG